MWCLSAKHSSQSATFLSVFTWTCFPASLFHLHLQSFPSEVATANHPPPPDTSRPHILCQRIHVSPLWSSTCLAASSQHPFTSIVAIPPLHTSKPSEPSPSCAHSECLRSLFERCSRVSFVVRWGWFESSYCMSCGDTRWQQACEIPFKYKYSFTQGTVGTQKIYCGSRRNTVRLSVPLCFCVILPANGRKT